MITIKNKEELAKELVESINSAAPGIKKSIQDIFDELATKISMDIICGLRDNAPDYIQQAVDNHIKSLLCGDYNIEFAKWLKRYDAAAVRESIYATYTEEINKTISEEILEENRRLRKALEFYQTTSNL